MIQYIIPLIVEFLNPAFLDIWFYPVFFLALISSLFSLLRYFLVGR